MFIEYHRSCQWHGVQEKHLKHLPSTGVSQTGKALSQSTFFELGEIKHETNRIIPVHPKDGLGIDLIPSHVVPLTQD